MTPRESQVIISPFETFYSKYDWEEDTKQENGNYHCKCTICGRIFIGNKHRLVCKNCAKSSIMEIVK